MTTVMTILLRIIIGCLRGVCRCCQRLPVQVIANNLHKTRTHFERGLTNVITFQLLLYYFLLGFRLGLQGSTETW